MFRAAARFGAVAALSPIRDCAVVLCLAFTAAPQGQGRGGEDCGHRGEGDDGPVARDETGQRHAGFGDRPAHDLPGLPAGQGRNPVEQQVDPCEDKRGSAETINKRQDPSDVACQDVPRYRCTEGQKDQHHRGAQGVGGEDRQQPGQAPGGHSLGDNSQQQGQAARERSHRA
ncbi:hypothetical protein ACL1IF_09780 [Corynebacterium striatum]